MHIIGLDNQGNVTSVEQVPIHPRERAFQNMEMRGWTIVSASEAPLKIKHEDGMTLEGDAAEEVVQGFSTKTRWKLVPTDEETGLTGEEIFGISVRLRQELNSGEGTPITQSAWDKLQTTVKAIEEGRTT